MTPLEFIQGLPNFDEYSRKSKILLLAYFLRQYQGIVEFSASNIRACCKNIIKTPSQLPSQLELLSKGKKSPLMRGEKPNHYSLTAPGIAEVEGYIVAEEKESPITDKFISDAITYLKDIVSKVSDESQRRFIAEAVSCLLVDARRATIVMVWAGTLSHLYDFIIACKLAEFNAATGRRSDRYFSIVIRTKDDFSDIKESVFIEICKSAGIITNDVRKILDEKLGIRNTCAHPSSIEIHHAKVVNFVEDLVDNVILKYPLP